ncbi:MAG TPA: isopentenyl-diphosphate Delta-isomerase [Chitinophagaceae bacterium]|nr:isopentenyl-diphosphate Delta-isomerase [Chitinophagaceae bacterium]
MKGDEKVILVNEHDDMTGIMDKMAAHKQGLLHRAFSVFIFNSKGEMLLQQRALNKYHSAGLWTNACCSHPMPGEKTKEAAERRLMEELGFETAIEKIFDFVYKAEFENGLTEHEFDHVFAGEYEGGLTINPAEVSEACYKEIAEIKTMLQSHPQKFTAWFHIAFPRIEEWWVSRYQNISA